MPEAIENSIVNSDFADKDFADNDTAEVEQDESDQHEDDQSENVQTNLLDEIRISSVNDEILAAWREVDATLLTFPLGTDINIQRDDTGIDFTELEEDCYVNTDHGSLKDLSIKLGTYELPRFSCAAHKMNIAVRRAITSHKPLSKMLKKLSAFSAKIKHSIDLSKVHLSKKCC